MNNCLRLGLWACVLSSIPGFTYGKAPADDASQGGNAAAMAKMAVASEQEDFDLLRKALEEAHPGLYRYSTKAEMDRGFAAQRAKLRQPMTKVQFEGILAETLGLIRCGHTHLILDGETETAMKNARTFPLNVMVEEKRLMVVLNETAGDQTICPGMEIVEINGHKVPDLFSGFLPALQADGDVETGKWHDISGGFRKLYWTLIDQGESFTVKARDAAGKVVVAKLTGVTDAERRSNQNPINASMRDNIGKLMGWSHDNLSLRFLKDPDIAEIRLKYFIGGEFPKSVEDAFKTLHDKKTQSLIVDLRGNGGGEDEYVAMFLSYITDKPFRYFDHICIKTINPSFRGFTDFGDRSATLLRDGTIPDPAGGYLATEKLNSGLAIQQPGKYPFLGKIYVLIDGGSFSGAADFCAIAHHLRRATFIGTESGGGYYGNNSGMMPELTLPNSKFKVRIPLYEYWNAVSGYEGKRRGTLPDHLVEFSVLDAVNGVDRQLEVALKLASGAAPR